jgi:fucose 4-O-acetylase-like acetyltransferase
MSAITTHPDRNPSWDNVKAILIFMVVFGHFIELHIDGAPLLRPIWIFMYAFHMPMFALVSGMYSKASLDDRQSTQLIKNIVVPLISFELIYELTEYALSGKFSVYAGLIAPYWMLWYLASLLSWRLLLPLFSRLQFGILLALALALGTAYSEQTGYLLSLSRTLIFFPYFLLGWKLGPELFSQQKKPWGWSALAAVISITALLVCFYLPVYFDYRWLYGSFSLHRLGMANLRGSLYQLLQYTVSGVLGLSMLYLLTRKDLRLARIGKQSMFVFLWHGMALIILQQSGVLRWIFQSGETSRLLMSAGISGIIVWLCAHPYCEHLTRKLILKPMTWLLLPTQSLNRKTGSEADPVKPE